MSGMHDGVSKLWLVRIERGLNLDGFKTIEEMMERLLRIALNESDSPERREAMRSIVYKVFGEIDRDYEHKLPDFEVDPDRHDALVTGIPIRAKLHGRFGNHDIAALTRESLIAWLRSGESERLAERTLLLLLGHNEV